MAWTTPRDLAAILLSERWYATIAGPGNTGHQAKFRVAAFGAFAWTAGGTILSAAAAFALGRIGFDRPIDPAKLMACTGAVMGAWSTWFALATPEDTWDVTERLDTHLRGSFFKALFFPGLLLGLLGSGW
ncbi:hypothetical protein [Massilia pseudoviolaceinigra]|uniref:hypothetical protein n=1 Tax=Massilia pseudoviolaceinigra TaxID=3057165 RepID=UPI00279696C0|nr:hypothetical protein [Massilia sp. CCM 9206]MDQ1921662.1 hypothetical protein [Massilia sp. CCM 9206]